ncbi:MAG: heparinase II/III family protein [Proteobacteria bacterium]|nr:heparinase II/III family protein [Pseudomonadota bacterium]MBU1451728.1 heparinase II/III family protein [Pseudomonadota bacterium]MBU2469264.1 heparinase II/III family protein [Pseudomonadota bacterium]MBU2517548.1 heparinase II/III family protein [Pseudomonadota bacterium]
MHGRIRFFSGAPQDLGLPLDWHRNALSGQRAPENIHWARLDDFAFGDIKCIWELSRFGFTYPLVRAYWRNGDQRLPEFFWSQVEDWRRCNPPQAGVNWKCGQEISFRIMAWCFGLYGFEGSPASTPRRVAQLVQMMGVFGHRIEANLSYALNQQNNHGTSEAMGLFTLGTLFPEFKAARGWQRLGQSLLEKLGRELIYGDGAFCQHSFGYHRLMLQTYLWALRLGELNHAPFSGSLREHLARSVDFLFQLQDQATGRLPIYGQNDSSNLLPLNNCQPADFRPLLQAMHLCLTGRRLYPAGPWDEDALWLFGPEALPAPAEALRPANLSAREGGYYTLRDEQGFAMTRCANFRHRPGHADLLHVDLWWRGENVALDSGTYSYNAQPPWDNPLVGTRYHNTVSVDGQDQMKRFSRFLWMPWPRCVPGPSLASPHGHLQYWQGEHHGYSRLHQPVNHLRALVSLGRGWWLVLDRLQSPGPHVYKLHWLLPDTEYEWSPEAGRLGLQFDKGAYHLCLGVWGASGKASLTRAAPDSPRGWQAPHYQHRQPALALELASSGRSVVFWSLFAPALPVVRSQSPVLELQGEEVSARVECCLEPALPREPLVRRLRLEGKLADQLDVDQAWKQAEGSRGL